MSLPQGPCPVCNQEFKDGDDIVICPDCGAPYHRACYQQAGQCVFADRHAHGFEYQSPKAPPKETPPAAETQDAAGDADSPEAAEDAKGILCPVCGTINDAGTIFCIRCGTPLHNAATPPPGGFGAGGAFPFGGAYGAPAPLDLSGEIDDIPKKDWARYIGNSAGVYLPRMAQMQTRKARVSLMLSAFFVSPCYFAYRKMWGWAAIALVGTLLFSAPSLLLVMAEIGYPLLPISLEVLNGLDIAATYLSMAMRVVFALWALFLFQRSAGKTIRRLRKQHPEDAPYQEALAKKGGVSYVGVGVVIAVFVAIVIVLSALIGNELVAAYYPGLI